MINNCRVCGRSFFTKPLLSYENMPKSAQYLPDEKSLQYDKGVNLEVYQCSGCGLIQLSNEPVSYYKEVIRAADISQEMREFRKKQFLEFVQRYSLKGKKVLEVGCGRGEYLSIIEQCGTSALGLEYSKKSVDSCVQKGLKVSKGFIQEANQILEYGPFDAFFILNFLEHLQNPNETLRGIYNNLKDDAFGLIEVPNFEPVYECRNFWDFIPDHLLYFTKDTLTTMLDINGFEVIECKEVWYESLLSAHVKKRQKLSMNGFDDALYRVQHQIHEFIDSYEENKVAIWGASHQALSIISQTCISKKIKYVIDSAIFKQGKYTTASHIPIVPPNELIKNPVDAIIIMASGYSDEVAQIIRNDYSKDISVAILRSFGLEILNV